MGRIIDWIKHMLGWDVQPIVPVHGIEEIKQRLFELHNSNRSSPLARNSQLDKAAQLHCDYMASHSLLSHNEPSGDAGMRVKAQGYDWSWVGENIAYGQSTPEDVMNTWMNSSGHRSNILNTEYKEIGFGVSVVDDVWWWCVDFGSH